MTSPLSRLRSHSKSQLRSDLSPNPLQTFQPPFKRNIETRRGPSITILHKRKKRQQPSVEKVRSSQKYTSQEDKKKNAMPVVDQILSLLSTGDPQNLVTSNTSESAFSQPKAQSQPSRKGRPAKLEAEKNQSKVESRKTQKQNRKKQQAFEKLAKISEKDLSLEGLSQSPVANLSVQPLISPKAFSNFFEILEVFQANKMVRGTEEAFKEAKEEGQKSYENWSQRALVEIDFPEQPRTKVVTLEQIQEVPANDSELLSQSFINCDLRFFNLQYLVEQLGHFEVVMIDPPWRIKGAQRNNSSFMFSNNKFNLDYSTMSNAEIMNIQVEVLSKKGFCFLWILNSQMHVGYECLNKWGYEVVDQLQWIKTKNKKIHISHGFYFLHSSETCLVGYKCQQNDTLDFKSKVSNNLIVGEIRKKSQKPDQIYSLIDLLVPGAKKVELFARNNNLRPGWLSLGNQLGENYINWKASVNCDSCHKTISSGQRRFKSKVKANFDVCQSCYQEQFSAQPTDFFALENQTDEDILHEYHQCNLCHCEPIWGVRFKCFVCPDVDLCENCFDSRLAQLNNDCKDLLCAGHQFECVELPLLADGLAAHNDQKCVQCYMRPIIGACFVCADCSHFSLCQNCYFTRPQQTMRVRGHSDKHRIELIVEPRQPMKKHVKCNGCAQMPIQRVRYKCNNCFDFDFCDLCYHKYAIQKQELKTVYSTSHKQYHTFTRLELHTLNTTKLSVEFDGQTDKPKKGPRGRPSKKVKELEAEPVE